ncbi:MAG: P1 family peptidase [Rhizomicrobium sp.]
MNPTHRKTPSGRLRARGAGVPFTGTPGPNNAITDVANIEVGYCTLISGEGPLVVGQGPIRTGVTAIFPHGRARPNAATYAGYYNMSGNGEMTGMALVEERGRFDGPITITNTHSCGLARDVTAKWLYTQLETSPKDDQPFWLPVSAETFDGNLNDINGHHIKAEHVIAAFEDAHGGAIEEGSVGGGTGMRCYEFKGGSGTASRVVGYAGTDYCVGAFVQSNFGKRHLLHIAGIPIGREIPVASPLEADDELGSIIIIVATDAPMMPHQLRRVARRASFGIARSGGIASNESGDLILAFSTGNRPAVDTHTGIVSASYLGEEGLSRFYEATIEAVDEAIMNSIFANETMTGRDGRSVPGLPVERIRTILKRHNRLEETDSQD